ncbi:hypothetical protein PV327_003068 [Microctonus hyperodae]|uniref:Uncharacterized protein n=1 Tax=Microctonus hyperodae TaxID=165561 RepID=A0AA39G3A2_MICHY|nr:hypothetical protein PV327_003068 [Microctonus hyperodae]
MSPTPNTEVTLSMGLHELQATRKRKLGIINVSVNIYRMSCAMDYQQLVPPPVPVVPHQSHHHHNSQQQQQQQPALAAVPPTHPHIVLAPAHQPQQPPPNLPPPTTHAHQVHPPLPPIHDDSTSSRWTQYQHIWRQHHVYVNGKLE